MISVEGLKVEFNATPLFEDVSYVINKKDRIALVGKNGAGKSTMLKILAGIQQPTAGIVAVPRECTIGYLPQVMILSDKRTVMQEAELAFEHIFEMQAGIERMNRQLAERTDYDSEDYQKLIDRFTHENERFLMMGGTNYRAEIERTLQGLGFSREDFDRSTSEFSGGWRMRIELAKLLLRRPDVLLLDEPTNHLDMKTKDILKQAIKDFNGTVIVVSHDREFLDGLVEKVYEFGGGQVKECLGGIYEFLEKKKLASLSELERTVRQDDSSKKESVPSSAKNADTAAAKTQGTAPGSQPSAGKLSYAQQREHEKLVRKARKKVEEAEAEVSRLELVVADIEKEISAGNPPTDIYDRHAAATKQLENAMSLWELASLELDSIS